MKPESEIDAQHLRAVEIMTECDGDTIHMHRRGRNETNAVLQHERFQNYPKSEHFEKMNEYFGTAYIIHIKH